MFEWTKGFWRRRESNPRPTVQKTDHYMLSLWIIPSDNAHRRANRKVSILLLKCYTNRIQHRIFRKVTLVCYPGSEITASACCLIKLQEPFHCWHLKGGVLKKLPDSACAQQTESQQSKPDSSPNLIKIAKLLLQATNFLWIYCLIRIRLLPAWIRKLFLLRVIWYRKQSSFCHSSLLLHTPLNPRWFLKPQPAEWSAIFFQMAV